MFIHKNSFLSCLIINMYMIFVCLLLLIRKKNRKWNWNWCYKKKEKKSYLYMKNWKNRVKAGEGIHVSLYPNNISSPFETCSFFLLLRRRSQTPSFLSSKPFNHGLRLQEQVRSPLRPPYVPISFSIIDPPYVQRTSGIPKDRSTKQPRPTVFPSAGEKPLVST